MFTQGPSITSRLVVFALASILLMTVDHRAHHLESLRSALSVVVYPLEYLVDLPVAIGRWTSENMTSRRHLLEENSALRTQQFILKTELQRMSALEAENQRLRVLRRSSAQVSGRIRIAEIMAVDLDPYKHHVTINRGSLDGVCVGQPILDADGVMGQVIHVGPLSATAVLITDVSSAIPVQVNRNGLRAIAMGTGNIGRLDLPHLPNNADIRVGDLLVTSGLGGRFPLGYPVARVSAVRHDPGEPFANVTAIPTAHLERSREVMLVWPETGPCGTNSVAPATRPRSAAAGHR
ncbi:MAG: rod shape-determining protein MreC [Chromatiales bacterium 21-64-14]|nr:MAG: rod shape-determining protein MreC [Chromatiales bacterium 21-64-14]HQU15238.1 rod shape-determining protein MreC [Gammaproteobacteria bacterium]